MDYKLVATVDIEHLSQAECAQHFHAAQMTLEEENARHAKRVDELSKLIFELGARVLPADLEPRNAAKIRADVRMRANAEAAKSASPAA